MTMINRPRGRRWRRGASGGRGRRSKLSAVLSGLVVGALALSASILFSPSPAQALARGEQVSFPGGLIISNFVLPNGKRAYCIEVGRHEPSGYVASLGRLSYLPGMTGMFPSWGDEHGMRQMNYLMDRHGQTGDAWTAAAVQLTIWRMRENFQPGNTALDQKIGVLMSSDRGKALIVESDRLYADAKANAKPPVAPKGVTDSLEVTPDAAGTPGRYRVAYPKGTTSLSVDGGVFVRNDSASITVPSTEASARYVQANPGVRRITVSGTWESFGTRGWNAVLDVHNTATSTGESGQRIAVTTGSSTIGDLGGRFSGVRQDVPPPPGPPTASSQAQPDATVGGTMSDRLIVSETPDTTLEMWPNAVADFTAYLEPTAGAQKFDEHWNPVLGDPYEAQVEDPRTGALMWEEWWTNAAGEPLLDGDGNRIPVADEHGAPTSGIAADGTPYPVPELAADGTPKLDDAGRPKTLRVREPVMEERRDPQTWTEAELQALSDDERCLAQPVFHAEAIPVPGPGEYSSPETQVTSGGTIHWVERVVSQGKTVHEGTCGLANETTRIDQPAVVTQALPEAVLGDELYDVATISGKLAEGAKYSVRFEAYRAPEPDIGSGDEPGNGGAVDPACTAENIIFRSEAVPVEGLGEVRSPGFTARPEHGTTIWWVETLVLDTPEGPRTLHRGECGLANETTTVGRPAVETLAMETAPVGAEISDTAIVSGALAENDGARWELTFAGYRAENATSGARAGQPVCSKSNRVFETEAIAVTGPGEIASPSIVAQPDWAGALWWVETLWLIQGDTRVAMHTGECGIATETTAITVPEVATDAVAFAAVGDRISDAATITGPLAQREGLEHRIVFRGYRGDASATGTDAARCSEDNLLFTSDPVTVHEAGTVRSPEVTALPEYGDTIWWVETLSQWENDVERELHRGACGIPGETTTVQGPTVRTESAGSVEVGQAMFDTAFVTGPMSERDDVEFRVRFAAYGRDSNGELECTPETELPELSDPEGVAVNGPGKYQSKRVVTRPEHVGLGGFVETLVMIEAGSEYVVAQGACGAPGENFEIRPVGAPALATTGKGAPVAWLAGGGVLLLLGSGAVIWGLRRRRVAPTVFRECRDMVS
ncbi:hypothetical protein PQI23_10065 [Leucobacter sp. USCH14]|uniref:hypothetical protein n=1 Tax=Leucobacter sp. USCH14 TaxID=3024838 RepID=UPI0030A4D655